MRFFTPNELFMWILALKHRFSMVYSMRKWTKMKALNLQWYRQTWLLLKNIISIGDFNGKNMIFGNFRFLHIKSIFQKCVKKESFFEVLPFKILGYWKTAFFEREKKSFFVSKIFSRGPMALKTCGKDA